MEKKCIQCGKDFTSKHKDARFCSDACRKAYSRKQNLMLDGVLIRGQHEDDIPPTPHGIYKSVCRRCGREFSHWMESKLARLVRNEVEGSIHWESRDFDQVKFSELKAIRMEEIKFCSEECQGVVVKGPDLVEA